MLGQLGTSRNLFPTGDLHRLVKKDGTQNVGRSGNLRRFGSLSTKALTSVSVVAIEYRVFLQRSIRRIGRIGQIGQIGQIGRIGRIGQIGRIGRIGYCLVVRFTRLNASGWANCDLPETISCVWTRPSIVKAYASVISTGRISPV